MRVLTWNLWWQFGNWEERQPVIDEVLRSVDADVLCLQEVYCTDQEDQFARIQSLLGFHGIATIGTDGARARFGNAILSRFPIDASSQQILPAEDGKAGHRSALYAHIHNGVVTTTIACTHLEWRYHQSLLRQRQLEAVVAQLPNSGPEQLVILAGDFNAVPESDEIRRLTGLAPGFTDQSGRPAIFTDSWAAVGDGPGFTWTRENPNSADAQWPRRRIDSVLVGWPRPKPHGNPLRARLDGHEPGSGSGPAGVVGSDHSAVVVELDPREPFVQ